MEKRKFDKELLDLCLLRDGATLILIKYLNDLPSYIFLLIL
jgi:hypothetical protein